MTHCHPERSEDLASKDPPYEVLRSLRTTVDAQAYRHQEHHGHRRRSDRDRAGLRVRLLGRAGVQGAEGRGLSRHPDQLQPGHDHDRSGAGGRDLHRADHARHGGEDHREGKARRHPADHGRPDGAQHGDVAASRRPSREARRRTDRRQCRGDRQGRRPPAVPRRHDQDRPRIAQERGRAQSRGSGQGARPRGPARDHPPVVHAGRHRRRHRLQSRRVLRHRAGRPRSLAHDRSAGRGVRARLERVRDGGRARPQGQLHHHLLDRERRSDGRAHRRLGDGGAGADAHRQGIPDHARRLDRVPARDRRRYRRIERAVRRRSGDRPHGRHRDEPARVALFGAGLEGDRLPDRQGRGAPGRRLHARRIAERHHRGDAGLVRTDHRLRRHQDAALRLREVPRSGGAAHHLDEERGRGDGDRAHLPGVAAEGAAFDGDRA